MKKLFKGVLIASGILLITGIGLGAAGLIMGASYETVSVPFYYGKISERLSDMADITEVDAGSIRQLRVEVKAGQLEVEHGEFEEIQIKAEQSGTKVDVKTSGDTLIISSRGRWGSNGGAAKIYLPDSLDLRSVDIEVKGGSMELDGITADEVSVEVGGGEFVCEGPIEAKESDFEVGAGAITVRSLNSVQTSLDCSAGMIACTVSGEPADYYFTGECSLGKLSYGDQEWNGNTDTAVGDRKAGKTIDAECGMGEIKINFERG